MPLHVAMVQHSAHTPCKADEHVCCHRQTVSGELSTCPLQPPCKQHQQPTSTPHTHCTALRMPASSRGRDPRCCCNTVAMQLQQLRSVHICNTLIAGLPAGAHTSAHMVPIHEIASTPQPTTSSAHTGTKQKEPSTSHHRPGQPVTRSAAAHAGDHHHDHHHDPHPGHHHHGRRGPC